MPAAWWIYAQNSEFHWTDLFSDWKGRSFLCLWSEVNTDLFGRHFTLITDHNPTSQVCSVVKNQHLLKHQLRFVIGLCTHRCLNMWFNFVILQLAVCWVPLTERIPEGGTPPELVLLVDHLNSSPVIADQICAATRCDPQSSHVACAARLA